MMRADTLIREEGMRALSDKLGLVTREKFDYTKWQESLYENVSLKDLAQKADALWRRSHDNT